jgi:mannan endo-1,4-beta-mannosidase
MDMQWLGWNASENWPNGAYTSHADADAIFSSVRSMNDRVIRSYGLVCVGANPGSLQTSLTTFNDAALEPIDYELSVAPSYGIHFNFPLVDNWVSPFGGKHVYTDWRGITDETQFYSNATVIQDYENHIAHVLNHVNQYTGIAYRNDPSIMSWETGNELDGAPDSWTEMLAEYIKSIDPNHLVLDGKPFRLLSRICGRRKSEEGCGLVEPGRRNAWKYPVTMSRAAWPHRVHSPRYCRQF